MRFSHTLHLLAMKKESIEPLHTLLTSHMTVCSCRPEPVAAYPFPNQTARVTFPERRHLVHTLMCFGEPLTIAFTRFTLGFHARLERLWEWET
jgi:hypothetical protein